MHAPAHPRRTTVRRRRPPDDQSSGYGAAPRQRGLPARFSGRRLPAGGISSPGAAAAMHAPAHPRRASVRRRPPDDQSSGYGAAPHQWGLPARFSGRRLPAGGISSPGGPRGDARACPSTSRLRPPAASAGRSIVRLRCSAPSTGLASPLQRTPFASRRDFIPRRCHGDARACPSTSHHRPPTASAGRSIVRLRCSAP